MVKILYLMHIPWGWIKQRPHFFAEYLAKDCIVDVYYRKSNTIKESSMVTKKNTVIRNITINSYIEIPFKKIPILKHFKLNYINTFILKNSIKKINEYDYIWISSPNQFIALKPLLKNQKIIYDCMDDIIEFPAIKENVMLKKEILKYEKELFINAHYKFFSSNYLRNKLVTRYELSSNGTYVINNAIKKPSKIEKTLPNDIEDKITFIKGLSNPFLYVGMISPWFDLKSIIKLLETYSSLNFVLIGPCEIQLPKHDRIHYLGSVERSYIFPLMEQAKALIMPFCLNELIYSVNPVKLYEYIYTKKPVISVKYGETEKFSEFVNLYSNDEELINIVGQIIDNPHLYVRDGIIIDKFIENNTWSARYEQIKRVLDL